MKIGLYNVDGKMPNIALMKLSTWHKKRGDNVEWWQGPLFRYDNIYASSIFTYSDKGELLPEMIKGGSGIDIKKKLPNEIDDCPLDYSIYPKFKPAIGFLTRGCPNKCEHCVVPEKEGNITPYRDIDEVVLNRKEAILFDNNILASQYGIAQIERIVRKKIKVDFNQGLDARLVTSKMARLLSKVTWARQIRFACDSLSMKTHIADVVNKLSRFGIKPYKIFVYMLVRSVPDALDRAMFLKKLGVDPFAQPFIDFTKQTTITREQRNFARWVNHKAIFKTVEWKDYK